MTMQDLADRVGVSAGHMADVSRGRRNMGVKVQARVESALNAPAKERPTLEVDPVIAPVVKEIFESSLRGNGLKEICKELNDRGITNRGKRWYKGVLHYLLTNEAYTGISVWAA